VRGLYDCADNCKLAFGFSVPLFIDFLTLCYNF
jgi:hypothetical protein